MKTYPRYKRYDLGKQQAGTVIEIVLSCVNNVRLMDHANFTRYAEAKSYKFIGGRIEKSPTRLTIPMSGSWHVVVDKIGFQTLANSNVRALVPNSARASNAAAQSGAISGAVQGVTVDESGARLDSEAHVVTRILNELNTYKQIANTDVLTGLANRRAFDARMSGIFSDPQTRAATALIITDIDHFKSFNDTYGHAVGDAVLKIVASTMQKSLPDTAFAARTGGEEFAVIVESVSAAEARDLAETVRRAVETAAFVDEATGTDCGQVTLSLGVCMATLARDPGDLYAKADAALYDSKNAGRNRTTMVAEAPDERPAETSVEPVIYSVTG